MRWRLPRGAADARACAAEAAAAVRAGLGGAAADVAFVFVSAEHAAEAEQVAAEVARELSPGVLVGASTEAVIGAGHEFEGRPAVSVLAASLGSGTARARHIAAGDAELLELAGPAVIVADPYTFPIERLLDDLNDAGAAVAVGGLASGGRGAGEHVLLCGEQVHREGAVIVDLSGPVELRALVSQGCAPIGPEMVVTQRRVERDPRAGGTAGVRRLVEIVGSSTRSRRSSRGAASWPGSSSTRTGSTTGPTTTSSAASWAATPSRARSRSATCRGWGRRSGSTSATRRPPTRASGRRSRTASPCPGASAAACSSPATAAGRGSSAGPTTTPPRPRPRWGGAPVAGMFCAGEIGPVGGRTFLHGFTATLALFVEE